MVRQGNQHYTLGVDQTTTNINEIQKRKLRWIGQLQEPSPIKPSLRNPDEKETNGTGYTRREIEKMAYAPSEQTDISKQV